MPCQCAANGLRVTVLCIVKRKERWQHRSSDYSQIAPFPFDLILRELRRYPNAEVMWAQVRLNANSLAAVMVYVEFAEILGCAGTKRTTPHVCLWLDFLRIKTQISSSPDLAHYLSVAQASASMCAAGGAHEHGRLQPRGAAAADHHACAGPAPARPHPVRRARPAPFSCSPCIDWLCVRQPFDANKAAGKVAHDLRQLRVHREC
jgi:hypothetical protein